MNRMTPAKQQGFSLFEVVVSLFVLAAGILGVTNLQTSSLHNATKSIARTQAAYLAYEILDRMRANQGETYSINNGDINTATNCFTNQCTTAQLRVFDLTEWKCNFASYRSEDACALFIASGLSTLSSQSVYLDGDGAIDCQEVGSEKQCSVVIEWRENHKGQDEPKSHDFSMTVVL